MADSERENSYYHPGGVPITPQARKFGYEFPVWVSENAWNTCCISIGVKSAHNQTLDGRILRLLMSCYEGMAKKLASDDGFLWYDFKHWFWSRNRPEAKKMIKMKLAARLFLDPLTDGPWLYIFAPNVDSIDDLEQGEAPLSEVAETILLPDDGEIASDESASQQNEDQQSELPQEENTIAPGNQFETVEAELTDQSPDQFYIDPATSDE